LQKYVNAKSVEKIISGGPGRAMQAALQGERGSINEYSGSDDDGEDVHDYQNIFQGIYGNTERRGDPEELSILDGYI
jgi:hypothetical protein